MLRVHRRAPGKQHSQEAMLGGYATTRDGYAGICFVYVEGMRAIGGAAEHVECTTHPHALVARRRAPGKVRRCALHRAHLHAKRRPQMGKQCTRNHQRFRQRLRSHRVRYGQHTPQQLICIAFFPSHPQHGRYRPVVPLWWSCADAHASLHMAEAEVIERVVDHVQRARRADSLRARVSAVKLDRERAARALAAARWRGSMDAQASRREFDALHAVAGLRRAFLKCAPNYPHLRNLTLERSRPWRQTTTTGLPCSIARQPASTRRFTFSGQAPMRYSRAWVRRSRSDVAARTCEWGFGSCFAKMSAPSGASGPLTWDRLLLLVPSGSWSASSRFFFRRWLFGEKKDGVRLDRALRPSARGDRRRDRGQG